MDREAYERGMKKYPKDGPFKDPVVRCDSCHTIINRTLLQSMGCCPRCGTRKVRNVLQLTSDDLALMRDWNIDPDFIALFEPVTMPEGVTL